MNSGSSFHAGQLLCGGFQGTTVTPQAYQLIVEHHVSSMILSRKNAINVEQMTKLIKDLQYIAYKQGNYKYPIMFAIDEEGGMMNSLIDVENLTQYPGAMALSATGDSQLVYEISKAIAIQLKYIGFSIILGPVLDVVTKFSSQLLGVRSFGTSIEDVTKYGLMCAKGLKDGGMFTVGKHFPGMGNANVDSLLDLPMMSESLEQLKNFNVKPFEKLIENGVLDGISAAGCGIPNVSPDETHACLSPIILNQLLRKNLNFQGFVISECLEMEALYHSIGLGQGVTLAINAGCDLVMVCHDLNLQYEAIDAIEKGVQNGNLEEDVVMTSYKRIENLQKKITTWNEIFPHGELSAKEPIKLFKNEYPELWAKHQKLSKLAYEKSITLIRDYDETLPITKCLTTNKNSEILILSPLVNPIYTPKKNHEDVNDVKLYSGEEVFQKFGNLISNYDENLQYRVLHSTYTAHGVTQLHETLISKAKLVIILTSEASRNLYQISIVKYVSVLCGDNPIPSNNLSSSKLKKPLIIVATSSPYDFLHNKSIGSSYLCCYDYTNNALECLTRVLFGDLKPTGSIPGEMKTNNNNLSKNHNNEKKSPSTIKRKWLVEEFNLDRDWSSFINLWRSNLENNNNSYSLQYFKRLNGLIKSSPPQKHFVVRNSSLNILYGIILTWISETKRGRVGNIVYLLVDKSKRLQNIGKNLYNRAIRYLIKEQKCNDIKIGITFPLIYMNNSDNNNNHEELNFFNNLNWKINSGNLISKSMMVLNNVNEWSVPKKILKELMIVGIRFDICNDTNQLLNLLENTNDNNENLKQIYNESIKKLFKINSSYEVKIIIALEPNMKNPIGSIIIFTNKSELSKFYPFIDDINKREDQHEDVLIGGIVAPIIDPTYSNLAEIFKVGLISSAITFLKTIGDEMKTCIMFEVNQGGKEEADLQNMGFEKYANYYDYNELRNCKTFNI
ncbi:unnamed protein product [Candida verbasci]|uniref:Glycoside hydrolase family 3 N-terminal domain-containing protein n=1 Tax=Candida verbasci TaxID=1227364 RepID=A0A9W4TR92_9ASCO|nr:unnamed protein product [Candida verbasci]